MYRQPLGCLSIYKTSESIISINPVPAWQERGWRSTSVRDSLHAVEYGLSGEASRAAGAPATGRRGTQLLVTELVQPSASLAPLEGCDRRVRGHRRWDRGRQTTPSCPDQHLAPATARGRERRHRRAAFYGCEEEGEAGRLWNAAPSSVPRPPCGWTAARSTHLPPQA